MTKLITITSLTGTEPYDIYLCNNSYGNCIYINTIMNSDVPYTFIVPSIFLPSSSVGVKAVDNHNCEIKNIVNI
jgi:hypothetical protein